MSTQTVSLRDVCVDAANNIETTAIGLVSCNEFAQARAAVAGLNDYVDYQEWLDVREGLQMSLAMAGVDARVVTVLLSSFLTWCKLSNVVPTEQALDAFAAAHASFRAASAAAALVQRADFELYIDALEAFADCGTYEKWLRRREAAYRTQRSSIVDFPVNVGDFIAWCECLGESTSETSLDKYATLVMEYLMANMSDSSMSVIALI